MNQLLITSANTLGQLQQKLDILSHNIANLDTNGYKRREASFTDLINQNAKNMLRTDKETGRLTPNGIRIGNGAKISQSQLVGVQGNIAQTGRKLDFAFTKENQFFKVLVQENGQGKVHYTRDGAFAVTPVNANEVMLVTEEGHPVLGENNQPITFNPNSGDIVLENGGRLRAGGQTLNIGVVEINRPQFLTQTGSNLLTMPDNPAVPENEILQDANRGDIAMQQNALEKSNVDFAKEMADLTNVQRAYQFQSRSISLADQMMGLINGVR
ncbi:flagellar hook-basal body protein [Pseudobacillus wudalianchiensis]|uniref:Flagellar biosynthesis protein FlgG n=1 Tax=Pseudobacillus wudalianchiensis TaxID=1743143 RepID=A0A1B9AYB0_9BACI|nr:flagellar hook-basal body protein [Bacillus wudalianchiensis]OCA88859.1 flagellar biosynthesis protein FlgG [Bacillus wudalianchiensis]